MRPHHDRRADSVAEQNAVLSVPVAVGEDTAIEHAADALREVEVEAAKPAAPTEWSLEPSRLESMNIDELRAVARELDVHDRATIIERDELLAEIRQRM